MSNYAKQISDGIEGLGDKIALPRSGFRAPVARPERPQIHRVAAQLQPTVGDGLETVTDPMPKKATSPFDRITFEITPEQRAHLTNIANTLNFRVPRDRRVQKINRDMLMRAMLTIAEKIDWESAQEVFTEDDLRRFVNSQVSITKKEC